VNSLNFNQSRASESAVTARLMTHRMGCFRTLGINGLACLMIAFWGAPDAWSATVANAQSAVGMNLQNVNYYSAEQPFLDIFKTTGGWLTHSMATSTWDTHEEAYLQLDASGYPTTLTAGRTDPNSPQKFDSLVVLLLRDLPNSNAGIGLPFLPGQYVVLYDGEGTLACGLDATLVHSAPGRMVVSLASPPTRGSFALYITSTDPKHTGNHIRNIRVFKAENENLLAAGNIFAPKFLNLMQNFRVLRAIQWLEIDNDGGTLTNWSQRPLPTDGGWGGPNGVPLEVVLQLCNAVGADCWLNVPHMATDDYITQMATLAHAKLGSNQKAYVEFSNEVWNSGYAQSKYATVQGQAKWPNASAPFDANRNWYGMRTAQTCDIWKTVWGVDAIRVVCIMAAHAANPWTATRSLDCPLWTGAGNAPCASHGINVVAIAPYFSVEPQDSWKSASDGGLSGLFSAINSSALPTSSAWEAKYRATLAPYKLPFIAYESGESLVGFPKYQNGSEIVKLYTAANRDPRMGAAYTTMLNDWKSNGGQLIVIYADIAPPSQYGDWGALESLLDTVTPLSSAPPKWQAIQNFITTNKCWWAGCTSSIGAGKVTEMPPSVSLQ
jgi:hypothetical protein